MYMSTDDAGVLPLRDYIDEYITIKHSRDEDRTKHIHVTDLSRCPVGVYLEKLGIVKSDINTSKLRRFEVGHQVEEVVREALSKRGVVDEVLYKELKENGLEWKELGMKGTPDIPLKGNEIVEVKSIHPFALDAMEGKPHEHYIEQLNLYLGKIQEMTGKKWTGRLFYLSLDGRTNEYVVSYDLELYKSSLMKAQSLREAIDNKRPPTPLPEYEVKTTKRGTVVKTSWKVTYCIGDGVHEYCSATLKGEPFPNTPMGEEDRKRWQGRMEYQAKKLTEEL